MQDTFCEFFGKIESLRCELEALRAEYEIQLSTLRKENAELHRKLSEIQLITKPHSATQDEAGAEEDSMKLSRFPRFSEFYKIPIEYYPNFEKAIRDMEHSQRELVERSIRRLALRGYHGTRSQQDHKKFEGGSKGLPVPQHATVSKSGRTLRYFWKIADTVLYVFYVGKRGDVYRSER